MKQTVWCYLFRCHKYEILKEEDYKDVRGIVIGKVIISRCVNCGHIKSTIIITEQ